MSQKVEIEREKRNYSDERERVFIIFRCVTRKTKRYFGILFYLFEYRYIIYKYLMKAKQRKKPTY
jgi:hypothetical protein